ncbi:BLUF domain-containing protein [Kaarinaea lacus]
MSPLIRLIYVSESTNPANQDYGGIQVDVGRILMQSRKNNPRSQIGGVLYFSNNYFFQCLEGRQDVVNQLYNKIAEDPRHENVQTISVKRVNERYFSNWSMKYVALEENVRKLLKDNGYNTFEPYEFDDAMIDKLLKLFVIAKDFNGSSDQNYDATIISKRKPGFLKRLFRRRRTEAV